jgi:hypothetical protein
MVGRLPIDSVKDFSQEGLQMMGRNRLIQPSFTGKTPTESRKSLEKAAL